MKKAGSGKSSLAKIARESMSERGVAVFSTVESHCWQYAGIVAHLTTSLVVFREQAKLEFNGVQVWPRRSVADCRRGECERTQDAILRQLRIKPPPLPRWLAAASTLVDVFRELERRDIWPVVESLKEDDGTALYIGKIVAVERTWFDILAYDAEGAWEPVTRLSFAAVLRVEFGDTYSERFNAYMRAANPPPPEAEREFQDCRAAKR